MNKELGFKGKTVTPMTRWQMMAAQGGINDLFEPNFSGSRVKESLLNLSERPQGHGTLILFFFWGGTLILKASLNDQLDAEVLNDLLCLVSIIA